MKALIWIASAFAVAALAGMLPSHPVGILVDVLIFAILAMSLNLLLWNVGLPSLGHAAYFGAGAYAAGILSVHVTENFWLGLAAGVGAATAMGAVFALFALRTAGVYFLMITLALAQIVWAVAFTWRPVTGGDDGLRGISHPDLVLPGLAVDSRYSYFLLALVVLVVLLFLVDVINRSPFGISLRGIKESPERMAALGYNVWLHKYLAFVISAAIAGVAGVLFVYYKRFISPEAVSIVISAEVMLMVILGGARRLAGPLIGALVIVILSNVTSAYTDRWPFILGALYIFVVLAAPRGIIDAARDSVIRLRKVLR